MHSPRPSSTPKPRMAARTDPVPRAQHPCRAPCAPVQRACRSLRVRPGLRARLCARLRACLLAPCRAQRPAPAPLVTIQFCIAIQFLLPNPAASVTIQKLYRDTLPSQPSSLLQYKPPYCNTKPSHCTPKVAIH